MDLDDAQRKVIENKIEKGFNTTDVNMEFCLLYGEVAEAYEAFSKKMSKDEIGSELADVAIYLLSISEILGLSLQDEIIKKMKINKERHYVNVNGVFLKEDEID